MPARDARHYAALVRRCWSPSVDARPDFQTVLTLLLPIAKRAKREFKACPTAEQQLRRVQAAASASPAAAAATAVAAAAAGGGGGGTAGRSAGSGPSTVHMRRGVLAAVGGTERTVFTLGLNDVSRTATTSATSATSAARRPDGTTATNTASSTTATATGTATGTGTGTAGVPPQSQLKKNTSLQTDTPKKRSHK